MVSPTLTRDLSLARTTPPLLLRVREFFRLSRTVPQGHSDLTGMAEPPAASHPTLFGELVVEFFGSLVIAVFGFGVVAQVVVSKGALGGHDSIAWAWGLAVMLGVLVAGKVSGAHLNPAVTLTVAVFKGFPWPKVLPYILAQVAGWFIGALIIRFNYSSSIAALDPHHTIATQGIFSTLPGNGNNDLGVTIGDAFWDQVIGTAVLLFLIFAITDPLSSNPSPAISAFLVGLLIVAIGFAMGTNAGYAINPARDFGPRLMEFMTGYHGAWRDQNGELYFWVPIVGPFLGGLIGGGLYQATVSRTLPRTHDLSS